MDQLKQRFRERLVARIATLRSALADLDTAPDEAIATIRRIGHALHGSGGTYGFPHISAAGRAVETADAAGLRAAAEYLIVVLESEQQVARTATKRRVLLVDDDVESTALLDAIVSPLNAVITTVATAQEARDVLGREDFAMVVLDLVLPDADGRTVLLWMREDARLAETPVFVISGLGSARVQAECYAIGADGFFEKPIDPDVLRAAIQARIGVRHKRVTQDDAAPGGAEVTRAATEAPNAAIAADCRTVMLVEDDELVASIVKHRLSRAGFEVVHFTDGVVARDNADPAGVCVGILDIKIPGIDGFELLEVLRARPAFAGIPFIILTALGSERDVVRGLKLGASDYMLKPFSPTELVARVNRLLQTS